MIFLLGCILGTCLGYYLKKPEYISSSAVRQYSAPYKFVRPLLAIGRPDNIPAIGYNTLSNDISKYIKTQTENRTISSASVFFINYDKSGSFSINDTAKYAPASLLKVVVMIAYLKSSEHNLDILDHNLTYTKEMDQGVAIAEFNNPSSLVVGKKYTVESLIRKMIIDSDNGATNLLLSNINDSYINQIYSDLGIPRPNEKDLYTINAKDYSLFLRILFNATYLSAENSEYALKLLSESTYKDGLVAGLPTSTIIAHKYGEHVVTDANENPIGFELHDCGLIYISKDPYMLCIMAKGKTLTDLSTAIASISKMVAAGIK